MLKRIAILTSFCMLLAMPIVANSNEQPQPPLTISVEESTICVQNAAGETLEVYDLTGVLVARVRIDSQEKTISLNLTKGYYFLKIRKLVRKIGIK